MPQNTIEARARGKVARHLADGLGGDAANAAMASGGKPAILSLSASKPSVWACHVLRS